MVPAGRYLVQGPRYDKGTLVLPDPDARDSCSLGGATGCTSTEYGVLENGSPVANATPPVAQMTLPTATAFCWVCAVVACECCF